MPLDDRWVPLSQFIEDERLDADDLVRLADARRLPPHAWLDDLCMVDRSRLYSWRQLLRLEGIDLPSASECASVTRAEATA